MDDSATPSQIPDPPDPEAPTERTSGLTLETCYRHPQVLTGVHCTRCGRPICPDCMNPAPVGYQCPVCVAEARRVGPRRRVKLVLGQPGWVTTSLLIANIAMFLVEVVVGGQNSLAAGPNVQKLFDLGAMYPPAIAELHQYWRLISAMFLHAGLIHLALNMYGLYLFGYLIESAFGWPRFLAIYFISGFVASATSFAFGPIAVAVGASGAIFGLLGAWVAYNYRRRESAFASANLRWALMLIALNLFLGFSIAQIDNFAHIGGLVTGAVAGSFVEGFGPRSIRPLVRVGGLVALVVIGVALVAWRVATFPALRGL